MKNNFPFTFLFFFHMTIHLYNPTFGNNLKYLLYTYKTNIILLRFQHLSPRWMEEGHTPYIQNPAILMIISSDH
jgi:hypothetical protein